ncbi:unnamed protein product [Diabrotica balteata]|uniref:DNA mismatch repair proteins mutS family domain-containing protein n=1 Tax=Diabrotica balteata TaxID=107213 RepID=A0A9N9SPU0_DIABA|nr:unnamed protein product [Diabrotica balteata]
MTDKSFKALNLDITQQQEFVRYFRNLPEKAPSTIRFFNRTEFYSLHGDDTAVAVECTCARVKYMGMEPQLSYVTLSKGQFEIFLRELLLVRQYRVEVYVKKATKSNQWQLEYKGSPGNLSQFEDLLFENTSIKFNNAVMCLKVFANRLLAVACINISECKFEVCELTDNDTFSELESLIAQIGPKECILPTGSTPDLVTIKKLLERTGIMVSQVKNTDFTDEDLGQDLNRLLYFAEGQQRNAFSFHETNLKNAMCCLQAGIKFFEISQDEKNFNQFKISTLDTKRFVRIDNAALYALNVLPKPTPGSNKISKSTNTSCLKGLLDHCITAQGSRLLEQWIKQPLKDYLAINERLEIVETIAKNSDVRTQLTKDWLPRVTDLIPLSRKVASKKARLQDCYKVYQVVSTVPSIIKVLKETNNKFVKDMLVDPLAEIISEMENYQSMIEQTLDFSLVERAEFLIRSSYDESLTELHEEKEKIQAKMHRVWENVADELGLEKGKGVKLESTEQLGYFLRVTLKDEKILRKHKEFKTLGVIKGGCRFTNDRLTSLNDKYQNVNEEYKERQKDIVKEVVDVAAGYAESLKSLNLLIAKVDVLTSFAVAAVSARIPYVKPKIHKQGTGFLNLKQMRHPCIEAQSNMSFIPNDVTFEKEGARFYVITGPNMCGKSTYIRSVGTAVLMAHIGCLVPCSLAEISIVDAILVRVGAEDCQLKGLSTFMLEMVETSTIIKTATADSLVIIDELGRGTSTYDGCGLAWAIAEHLARDIRSFSMFATHFHEINELAENYDCVANLYVSALVTDTTMTPLYTIREGECDKSYGVHCARIVNFPDDVIQGAIEYQRNLEHQNGMKYLSDFEPSVKRKYIAEGDAMIRTAMKQLKSMDVNSLSDEELMKKVEEMKVDLLKKEHLFVKGLMDV